MRASQLQSLNPAFAAKLRRACYPFCATCYQTYADRTKGGRKTITSWGRAVRTPHPSGVSQSLGSTQRTAGRHPHLEHFALAITMISELLCSYTIHDFHD